MHTPSRSLTLHSWYIHTAAVLIVSLIIWALGLPGMLLKAEAVQLSNISNTLSTSKPGVVANHTISFTTPTGIPADGSTIEITIPNGFDMSFIGEDDIDIADDGGDLTTGASCGAVNAAVSTSTQTITIEVCNGGGGAITASSEIVIEVGTHADASGTGIHQVTNHASAGNYQLDIGGTMADSGATRLVIVESVTISGQVETFFDFQINGVNAEEAVNADATLTFATTTATSVPFSVVDPSTEYVLAQDLAVTTNSKNGYTVRVFADGDLQSSGGASINSFVDGSATGTPIAWVGPSAQSGSPDTYGHWGVTTEDVTLSDDDSFGDAKYVGDFISNPREVMYSTSSADGTTQHIGATRVGYKLEISTLQEAANDYQTRIVYIATPVF